MPRSTPDLPRPFRMWLYPLPALLARPGSFHLSIENWQKEMRYAVVILLTGVVIYIFGRGRSQSGPSGGGGDWEWGSFGVMLMSFGACVWYCLLP